MTIFIDREKRQFKANLHSHTTNSDGKMTVEELISMYKEHGYQILAITDHETPLRHSGLSSNDFLLLDGYEAYIRPSKKCIYNKLKPEIHLNLIAKNKDNSDDRIEEGYLPYLGYNFFYTKYFDKVKAKKLDVARKLKNRYFTKWYINSFIESAHKAGYFVFLNHPYWSMMDVEDINGLEGLDSIEIYNYSSMRINNDEGDLKYYDMYLRREQKNLFGINKNKKMPYCHGADDNHNPKRTDIDSFGAFTYIMADDLSYEAISKAISDGNYYASTGPMFKYIEISGKTAHIETSNCETIIMHISPKMSIRIDSRDNEGLSKADFKIPGNNGYVYFSIKDKDGKTAVSRYYGV